MAGASGSWTEWPLDPFEVDGAQTSSGYVRPGYYLSQAWDATVYWSLPQIMRRQANTTYAAMTGGRVLDDDVLESVVDTVEPLTRAATSAVEMAKQGITNAVNAAAAPIKTTLLIGAGLAALIAVAVIAKET